MPFATWFRRPNRTPRHARPSWVPRFEVLEDRTVPSTLIVQNAADSGLGSLRAAVAAAQAGDLILFSPVLIGQNVRLTTGEITLDKNLTIQGALTIGLSGNDASRVFAVANGVTVTLRNLTVTHGLATAGGGIDNAGTLFLQNCLLTANRAVGAAADDGGGAILNEAGATLTMTQCQVTNNTATAAAGMDVFGGGLLNRGFATVNFSGFRGNEARNGGGATFFAGSCGGAIDNFGGGTLTVNFSTFIGNAAIGAAGAFFGVGGAIENNAAFDGMTPGLTTVNNCTFTGNLATGGAGADGNGGALANEETAATFNVNNCVISGNRSVGGGFGDGTVSAQSQGIGGGMMNVFGTITITNTTFAGNLALGGDHSTPAAANPLTGGAMGGGLANFLGGTATVTGCTFVGNQARGGRTDAGPGGAALGGAIDNTQAFPPGIPASQLIATNCRFLNNAAIAGLGGPGVTGVLAGLAAGGAIDNSFHSNATLTGCQLFSNVAIGSTGGAGNPGTNGMGGAIVVGINALIGFDDASTLQVNGSQIYSNIARGGQGGTGANGGNGLGGGIAIVAASSATLTNTRIVNNFAIGGNAGFGGLPGQGLGGGVNNAGTSTPDLASLIILNHATTAGPNAFP